MRFEDLYVLYARRARVHVRRRLGLALRRRVNSDDVLQDVLAEAIQAFQEGKAPVSETGEDFFPWLTGMIENRIRNLARSHLEAKCRTVLREVKLESSEVAAATDGAGKTPSDQLINLEQLMLVDEAIAGLTARERELVDLIYFQGLEVGAAASRMGKTANATAVLHSRVLKKLADFMKRRGGEA